ncbi:hypothetical protein LH464_24060 [Neorhizobium sp. T786]|uniref:DUF6973 domain-containing protein n=1 Tax=Pseudorhizobium xiangyangii TaxID=2883104 RepID=UPI001CFF7CCA|nr:hypothetical protein [Neorhizobium xiangyangii]MCB5205517.1 hypothetical protein [Neorhizobium xiangyangii]
MGDYINSQDSNTLLSAEESVALKHEFGWSPVGVGDKGSALWHPLDAFSFKAAAKAASTEAADINTPGCYPYFDYQPGTSAHNDCRDAFRHAYWNALMAQIDEVDAASQANAHERSAPNVYSEHYMDLYNNRVGRKLGAAHPSASHKEIADLVKQELSRGGLITDLGQAPTAGAK